MPPGTGNDGNGKKRQREADASSVPDDDAKVTTESPDTASAAGASTTNFRNVSACNRCRNRKNRCDQKLPKCTNCQKANVRCVGFDPVSKREIPRSYVYYLETRVNALEALLTSHNLSFPPPSEDFAISDTIKPGVNVPFPVQDEATAQAPTLSVAADTHPAHPTLDPALRERDDGQKLEKIVNDVGMVSMQGAPDSRYSASTAGISFARVVFAAVKTSVNHSATPPDKGGSRQTKLSAAGDAAGTSMRDSFFGLHTKPTIKPAPFPDRDLGVRLTELYFEHANPQIPVLHRGEFMSLFERVYATDPQKRTSRELYMLNIVFAIGSGIIVDPATFELSGAAGSSAGGAEQPGKKRQRLASHQHQPEEYHSSAIVHLESFLGSSPAAEGVGGGMEELQAVLLLAGLALLRPVAPGLWYIIGVAVRLSIDLGLHFEDIDLELDSRATHPDVAMSNDGLGRKQWTRDLRRRLWWCVFNLDRLVASCVGRPVSFSETVVTTEFPSMLDDPYITPSGFLKPPGIVEQPSYKLVTRHYIRLRLLQSEILQVLQQRQADQARRLGANAANAFIPAGLESPFLRPFQAFRDWRANVDRRLLEWKETSPKQFDTGVGFNPLFLELNYWQAVIMLYRQSLSVPEQLASELSPATGDDVQSPGNVNFELEEDKQTVFLKVAEAGQMVLRIYRQLHRLKLVNYTFLATHHLFMSGVSFLYAIWHSALVRSQMTIDDVDFTILAAVSVLSDLIPMCPPAEHCRDAFVRMSKATISMAMSTTGFGNRSTLGTQPLNNPEGYFGQAAAGTAVVKNEALQTPQPPKRQMPKFDMDLKDLFSEEELATRPHTSQQPRLQGFLRHLPKQASISPRLPTNASPVAGNDGLPSYRSMQHDRSPSASYQPVPSQQTYGSFADASRTPQPQPHQDFPGFDNNFDFLNDYSVLDPSTNLWSDDATDLAFGSGATGGFESFQANELMENFFFGGNGSY